MSNKEQMLMDYNHFDSLIKGCLVRINGGAVDSIGKNALLLEKSIVDISRGEDLVDTHAAIVLVLIDGKKIQLMADFVTKIAD